MSICKRCGANNGTGKFCENCGAMLETPAASTAPQIQQPVIEQPVMYSQPQYSAMPPAYNGPFVSNQYMPRPAGGVMAGNIILIVTSVTCCSPLGFISLILGIIGVVKAEKISKSRSVEEEAENRKTAMSLMIAGYVIMVLGFILLFVSLYVLPHFFRDTYESIYEYFESVMETASFRIR